MVDELVDLREQLKNDRAAYSAIDREIADLVNRLMLEFQTRYPDLKWVSSIELSPTTLAKWLQQRTGMGSTR